MTHAIDPVLTQHEPVEPVVTVDDDEFFEPSRPFREFGRRFLAHPTAVAGLIFLMLLGLVALLAPHLMPYDPRTQVLAERNLWISRQYWLGTDAFGRDVLSRLISGSRPTILAPLIAVGIAALIGVPTGLVAGFVGGWIDWVLSRIAEAVMSLPSIALAIALVSVLEPSLTNAMTAVGIIFAPRLFRVVRAATISVREETYVEASTAVGCSTWRTLGVHVLPNIISPLLVQLSLLLGLAILAEASLSFLGLGVQPPDASWGSMLRNAFENNYRAPLQVIPPGVAIMLSVLAFNLVGDGLRDAVGSSVRKGK